MNRRVLRQFRREGYGLVRKRGGGTVRRGLPVGQCDFVLNEIEHCEIAPYLSDARRSLETTC